MKRYYVLIALMIVLPQLMMAQNFADAYRMSYNQIQGTARSAGMGNAFGALGGDFTSLSINPAGSAIYLTGEFVITPSYYINKTDMTVGGSKFSDNDQSFALNNVGAVGAFKTNKSEAGIVSINYGIGYNRLANYNSNSFGNYDQSSVSWLDDITAYANNEALANAYLEQSIGEIEYRDWTTKLAWDTYLIDPVYDNDGNAIDGQYQSILYQDEKVDQRKTFSTDGRLDEYLFNVSLNFNHKFYLGTTLAFHDIRYDSHTRYEEQLLDNNSYIHDNDYYMSGSGFNFKIGAIYKPVQTVRLGLAFHSPTFYQIDEKSVLSMDSYLSQSYSSYGVNTYNYDFNSPWKVVLSGAAVFAKRGLISVDAEYQDYASMRYRRGGYGSDNFNDLNSEMGDIFNSVVNLRIGAEYKLTNQFAVRAGYQVYGNPFKNTLEQQATLTDNTNVFSGGFGYTINAFSVNLAYSNSMSKISEGGEQPNYYQVPTEKNNHNILMSFGFRF
ncbi:OmpP1/FadL family transporter [Maribellus sediminis]|uniref:OmpP1/FadL family transporter n=1 Tax=Maribellus sediminis TaxID=2696285 RepID=UPI001430AD32|nr:outer membrane protein transport protein [Maribellus sediminis]